ncbi:MAG: hypothetical protein NDI67_09515 [Sulfuritalea sp.]|nr:hypothetical protein [Sulfuritalea sp.]
MKTKFQCRPTSALTTLSAAAGTKARTLQLGMIVTALLVLGSVTAPAHADDTRSEWRRDSREIRHDRRELRNDYRELAEDRADFQRARARGDIIGMFRERMEIRQDRQEIRRDQAELRHDLRDRRQDARGHQDQRGEWGQQRGQQRGEQRYDRHDGRHDQRAVHLDSRRDRAPEHPAQAANWQGPRQQHANPATASPPTSAQQNNGRQLGWQQGRGNPHRS